MATRRLANKQRRSRDLGAELENFLAGDDSALANDEQVRQLSAEVFFILNFAHGGIYGPPPEFTPYETRRLELLESRYQEWLANYKLEHYRNCARTARCLARLERLIKAGESVESAFSQAVTPGPNSIVYEMPNDEPEVRDAEE